MGWPGGRRQRAAAPAGTPSLATKGAAIAAFFFFNDPAPPEISPLPLHALLPFWPRRSNEKTPLGNPPAELLILIGQLQKIDHFADFLDSFIDPCHVVERHTEVFLSIQSTFA